MKKGIVTLIIGSIFFLSACEQSPEEKEKSQNREAIKICWKDYEKKSLTPETKRFVAQVCEKMENDFKKKFGVNP